MQLKIYLTLLLLFSLPASSKIFMFIHGGPGLNSNPEKTMLAPYFDKIESKLYLWNEPSGSRSIGDEFDPQNAFLSSTKSIEKKFLDICLGNFHSLSECRLTLIAHSFGSHYILDLSQKYSKNIEKIILISPVLNIKVAENNILNLAANELRNLGNVEDSETILSLIPNLSESFDELKSKAFTLANKYALLFTHYWQDKSKMNNYFAELNGNFSFDPNNFFLIRKTTPPIHFPEVRNKTIPVIVFFGEDDFISKPLYENYYIRKYFKKSKSYMVKNTGHYSYLERPEEIFKK